MMFQKEFVRLVFVTNLFGLTLAVFGASRAIGNEKVVVSEQFRIATFSADVTIPLGHRCMGVLPTKSKKIVDRLYAHGMVLMIPGQQPVVFCAVDWCEIRNGSYEKWRKALAKVANTTKQKVFLAALHQHDAPVVDDDAGKLLKQVGLEGELFDQAFQDSTINRTAELLKLSMQDPVPVTHYAIGKAKVHRIASNRRVVSLENGKVTFSRSSSSGRNRIMAEAPEGLIDPILTTISFWNGDQPVVALHSYATHPMSYYGRGGVTSDFVGLARLRRQKDHPKVAQIYFSGCSGDVTAGKYNDGSPEMRTELTNRLYQGMVDAWKANVKYAIDKVEFKCATLQLPFNKKESLKRAALEKNLKDKDLKTEQRILAAMGLASRNRVEKGLPIDFPCLDLGNAKFVLFPAESFVGYQLMAGELAPNSSVFSIGYGECWPGYIPTLAAFNDSFADSWLWAGRGSEEMIRKALVKVLK